MTQPILLPPCPFCGGPPVPIVTLGSGQGYADRQDDYGDDGLYVEAYVFCHECGAHGPSIDRFIYDDAEYDEAESAAVVMWTERTLRNRDLYNAGMERGNNHYPRPAIAKALGEGQS